MWRPCQQNKTVFVYLVRLSRSLSKACWRSRYKWFWYYIVFENPEMWSLRGVPLIWNLCGCQWRDNERVGVSDHWRLDCLLNRLFRRRSKKISKLRVIGLCEGDSSVTDGFPSQRASNAENVSIWWRHHGSRRLRWYGYVQRAMS